SRHVVLLVDYSFAVDLEKRHLVGDRLHDQRLGAIARDCDMRDAIAHGDRVGDFYVFARDSKYADRIVRPVGDERKITFLADVEARWLLADRHRTRELGRVGHRILSGLRYDRLTLVVPQELLVVADDQEWCGLDRTEAGDSQKCHTAE